MTPRLGPVRHGVTRRMGLYQHRVRAIVAVRRKRGAEGEPLVEAALASPTERRRVDAPPLAI